MLQLEGLPCAGFQGQADAGHVGLASCDTSAAEGAVSSLAAALGHALSTLTLTVAHELAKSPKRFLKTSRSEGLCRAASTAVLGRRLDGPEPTDPGKAQPAARLWPYDAHVVQGKCWSRLHSGTALATPVCSGRPGR